MKRFWVIIVLLVIVQAPDWSPVFAQSPDESERWYMRGLLELQHKKKIEYLESAIAQNEELYDAYLEISASLNTLNQYARAEMYLKKAYAISISKNLPEFRAQVLYALAGTYKALGKMTLGEEALRSARRLSSDEGLKRLVTVDLANALYQRDSYRECLTELRQLNDVEDRGNTRFVRQLTIASLRAIHLDSLYERALYTEQRGDLESAIGILSKIHEESPGFKGCEQRIYELKKRMSNIPVYTSEFSDGQALTIRPPGRIKDSSENDGNEVKLSDSQHPLAETLYETVPSNLEKQHSIGPQASNTERVPLARDNGNGYTEPSIRPVNVPGLGLRTAVWQNKIARQTESSSMTPAVKAATAAAFILSLPLLGYVMISPKIRARFFLLIRNYERAALLYEYIIFRKPQSLWVYPILARIYDEWGRSDRRALAVYRMLQHLTSTEKEGTEQAFSKRIAQKYLEDNRISVESVQSNKQPPVV